jgi:hypothetical protein
MFGSRFGLTLYETAVTGSILFSALLVTILVYTG